MPLTLDGDAMRHTRVVETQAERKKALTANIIGVNLAKELSKLHGAAIANRSVVIVPFFWPDIGLHNSGALCGQSHCAGWACWRGNAAGPGGWTFITRISLTTLQATDMGFFGLYLFHP